MSRTARAQKERVFVKFMEISSPRHARGFGASWTKGIGTASSPGLAHSFSVGAASAPLS